MASSSTTGASSGSTSIQNSGSDEDLQLLMDQRKLKRMQSNRESARRSRLRKQKHLDDLMAQVAQLRKENKQILTSLNITTQHYLSVESENSVLRTQMMELDHRLQSLNEITHYMQMQATSSSNSAFGINALDHHQHHRQTTTTDQTCFLNPLDMFYLNQPIMAAADMLINY